jgi:hypothetical protein
MFYLKRSINGENNMGLDLTLEEDEKKKEINANGCPLENENIKTFRSNSVIITSL